VGLLRGRGWKKFQGRTIMLCIRNRSLALGGGMFLKGALLSPVALRKTGGVDDGCSSRRFVSVNAADASVRPPLPLIVPMLHFFLLRCRRASTSSHTHPPSLSLSVVAHSLLGAETDRAELLACPTWERAHSSTVDTPTRPATPHPAHDRHHNHYDSRRRHYRDHVHTCATRSV